MIHEIQSKKIAKIEKISYLFVQNLKFYSNKTYIYQQLNEKKKKLTLWTEKILGPVLKFSGQSGKKRLPGSTGCMFIW
jgi:hypothetical protein